MSKVAQGTYPGLVWIWVLLNGRGLTIREQADWTSWWLRPTNHISLSMLPVAQDQETKNV